MDESVSEAGDDRNIWGISLREQARDAVVWRSWFKQKRRLMHNISRNCQLARSISVRTSY
jgi:hypothetical protein